MALQNRDGDLCLAILVINIILVAAAVVKLLLMYTSVGTHVNPRLIDMMSMTIKIYVAFAGVATVALSALLVHDLVVT